MNGLAMGGLLCLQRGKSQRHLGRVAVVARLKVVLHQPPELAEKLVAKILISEG
jgi:hypothetical protein